MTSINKKLIELVRNNTVLFDVSHSDYYKKTLKDTVWASIAEELNLKTGGEAKNIWLKLRSCHREALRRKATKSGSASGRYRPWKYEQQMEFLVDYMSSTNPVGNIESALEVQLAGENDSEDLIEDHDDPTDDFGNINPVEETGESISSNIVLRNFPKSRSEYAFDENLVKTLQQHQERANIQHKNTDETKHDELFHFFMSLYYTIKKMPPTNQLKMKRKIFNIVSEEEELCSNWTLYGPSPSNSFQSI